MLFVHADLARTMSLSAAGVERPASGCRSVNRRFATVYAPGKRGVFIRHLDPRSRHKAARPGRERAVRPSVRRRFAGQV